MAAGSLANAAARWTRRAPALMPAGAASPFGLGFRTIARAAKLVSELWKERKTMQYWSARLTVAFAAVTILTFIGPFALEACRRRLRPVTAAMAVWKRNWTGFSKLSGN